MYMNGSEPTEFGIFLMELMESHAKSVSGLDFNYSLDSAGETPVGHDSQNMSVPGKTKRSSAQPSFTFQELQGNLIHNAFLKWITDISPADHYASMASVNFPGAWCMSAYSMSMVAIQFDPTMLPDRIVDAAFYSNMWPQGTGGDVGFERQIGSMRFPERSITFSSIVHHNPYTKLLGMEIARQLKLHTVDYTKSLPETGAFIVRALPEDATYGNIVLEAVVTPADIPQYERDAETGNYVYFRDNNYNYARKPMMPYEDIADLFDGASDVNTTTGVVNAFTGDFENLGLSIDSYTKGCQANQLFLNHWVSTSNVSVSHRHQDSKQSLNTFHCV